MYDEGSFGGGFVLGFLLGIIGLIIALAIGKPRTTKGTCIGWLVEIGIALTIGLIMLGASSSPTWCCLF